MKIQLIFSLSLENSYHGRAIRLRTWTKPHHLHTVYIVAQSKRETLQLGLHVMGGCWERLDLVSHCWVWTGCSRLVYDINVKSETFIHQLCTFTLSSSSVHHYLFDTPWCSYEAFNPPDTQQLRAQASLHNIRKQQQFSLIPADALHVCLNSPSNTYIKNNQQVTTVPESCHSATALSLQLFTLLPPHCWQQGWEELRYAVNSTHCPDYLKKHSLNFTTAYSVFPSPTMTFGTSTSFQLGYYFAQNWPQGFQQMCCFGINRYQNITVYSFSTHWMASSKNWENPMTVKNSY